MGDEMAAARMKADVMFETLELLDVDFFCFHDLDIAPEGKSLKEFNANVTAIAKIFEKKMAAKNKKLLWGTANMFSNRRFMAGAATNPDPGCLRLLRGTGEALPRRDQGPRRRQLRDVGRPRGLRDAAQHQHRP